MSARIHVLPAESQEKIAAGQVVDSPLSVVKELVENSLDAGATAIEIWLENGGLDTIAVADNGFGIHPEDCALVFESHATSKIAHFDDVAYLSTHGFRGEALWSIAKVAQVELYTKQPSATVGSYAVVGPTSKISIRQTGAPRGTKVVVTQLFQTLPVRKKFLKSATAELNKCITYVESLAVAYPHISFRMHSGKKTLLALTPVTSSKERILHIHPELSPDNILTITASSENLRISGFITPPQIRGRTPQMRVLTINSRVVKNTDLHKKVRAAYGSLLEPRAYPAYWLALDFDPEHLDVNKHPRKEIIGITTSHNVSQELYGAVLSTLNAHDLTTVHGTRDSMNTGMDAVVAQSLRNVTHAWAPGESSLSENDILQVHKVYLLKEVKDGILVVDQHAAHERILYEEFRTTAQQHELHFPHTIKPLVKTISATAHDLLASHVDELQKLGFAYTLQSKKVTISAVPKLLHGKEPLLTLLDIAQRLDDGDYEDFEEDIQKSLAYLACRTAIKAGQFLSMDERKELLEKLHSTESQYACPHGRPVSFLITWNELAKLFHRA